ncbi:hypothetical protein [Algibacter sp. 2305UL17-15]|uniref:hypothetical protein n=1 Tax=Algibacter sp. 2305UL17-15 TaxID=3231268 RepID=UPI00345A4A89
MKQKTIEDYRNSILEKFNTDTKEGKTKYIFNSTPASIRNACVRCLNEEKISLEDKRMLTLFFGLKSDEDYVKGIMDYPDGKLRVVTNFLVNGTKPKRQGVDELVAWLIDFKPRPFFKFRNQRSNEKALIDKGKKVDEKPRKNSGQGFDTKEGKFNYGTENEFGTKVQKKEAKSKHSFKFLVILILIAILFFVYSISKSTHFISKDVEAIRKISSNELPGYLKTNHTVWKGVSNSGTMEYFATSGKHPVTGRDLILMSDEERRDIIIEKEIVGKTEEPKEEPKLLEKSILNPALKNRIDSKEMAIFIFGDDFQLNNKVLSQLQNGIFSNYNSTGNLLIPNKLNETIKANLISGNLAVLGDALDKHTDYVCVGNANSTFRKSTINSEITICDLELNIAVYDSKGIRQKSLSKSDFHIGQGFNEPEALKNAIKQIE